MSDYEKEHSAFLRRFGGECAVLLKTDGAFPLDAPCDLALYGSGARRTVKGGTGSGEVNSRVFVTAEDGLEAAGFRVTSKGWMDQRHPSCGTTIKHFAANNQETNRYGSNSLVSERAMREIYLRGFEIAVKESQPHALMTSYNLLNGTHTSEHRDLIEDILRCEFGFRGIVMTDWIIGVLNAGKKKYPAPNAARIAAAGGDLVMPGGPGDLKALLNGLKEGAVTRKQLLINASRVVRMAKKLTEAANAKKEEKP